MRRRKKIVHANGNEKKLGKAILTSDKIDFNTQTVTRDKEGHYIMIKRVIQEEDITIVNIYAPNIGAPKQILTDIKGKTDSNKVGTLTTHIHQWTDHPGRKSIRKHHP